MIEFLDPFGQETIITILPIDFSKRVHFAVNSKYKYIASWDIDTARQILQELEKSIKTLEEKNAKYSHINW